MTDGRSSGAPGRIPSLDGFRGVGMCAVLLTHLTGTAGFPKQLQFLDAIGSLGMRTFFILSGFLITTLLLKESSARGGVDLKAFYVRRMIRLLPAFAVYVTFVGIAGSPWQPVTVPTAWWSGRCRNCVIVAATRGVLTRTRVQLQLLPISRHIDVPTPPE